MYLVCLKMVKWNTKLLTPRAGMLLHLYLIFFLLFEFITKFVLCMYKIKNFTTKCCNFRYFIRIYKKKKKTTIIRAQFYYFFQSYFNAIPQLISITYWNNIQALTMTNKWWKAIIMKKYWICKYIKLKRLISFRVIVVQERDKKEITQFTLINLNSIT